MTPFRRLLHSWHKEEQREPAQQARWVVLMVLVISPLLVVHLINRTQALLNQQIHDREEAVALLDSNLGNKDRNVWDWSHWDDTDRFVSGHNPDYVQHTLNPAALFRNETVMLILGPNGSTRLIHSQAALERSVSASLQRCFQNNRQRIRSARDQIRLACQVPNGSLFLGSATAITNSQVSSAPNGSMVLLDPLLQRDDTPAMRQQLLGLKQLLTGPPDGTNQSELIQPAIFTTGGRRLGLHQPSWPAALRQTLVNEEPILLVLPLAAVLLRGYSLLERRRQRLRERRLERQGNQRLLRTCRELEQQIDELLPAARTHANPAAEHPSPLTGVEATTHRLRQFLRSARQLALFDALTQLPNRHYFIEQLTSVAAAQRRAQRSFAVLFIDIDKFKIINDSFGHSIGDAVLLEVCQRLSRLMAPQDFLARYGGDELAMILNLNHLADQSRSSLGRESRQRAEQIASSLHESVVVQDLSLPVRISIGITLVEPDEWDLAEVMQRSDLAMYQAKRNRTNRIIGPDDVTNIPQLNSYQLFTDLLDAIQTHQLQVYFQPIRNASGIQTGVEALARWQHPEQGWIEPAVFLEIAEQHRQMKALGDELIRLSLDGFEQLQEVNPGLKLFLNLAPSQLSDPRLASALLDALHNRNLRGEQIVLELTENTLLEPLPAVVANLEQLRAAGISLALDDFGTGYSSLVMLKSLSPDIVKIDKSFIQAVHTDSRALHIISLIAELAPRLGMVLVAEGIEDRATLQQLMHLGIERFQGHELGRPSPLEDLLKPAEAGQPVQTASNRSIV